MRRLLKIGYGTAFATAATASMLFGAAFTPTSQPATFTNIAAQMALAGEDENHGNQDCVNPAGHERGWCKHHGDEDRDGNYDKHRGHHKHHRGYQSGNRATISGTVLSINGNVAQVRLDDGRIITVDTAGTPLNVGQHYTLVGCYQNNAFVVNCNGSGQNPDGYGQQQVRGTILSVNGNIVTLLGLPPIRIDISRAQANGAISGSLTPARQITAYGHYQNGTFFATSIR